MATQRQPNTRPVVDDRSGPIPSSASPLSSRKSSLSTVVEENPIKIPIPQRNKVLLHPDDEAQRQELAREAARRATFDRASNKKYGIRGGYRKVEVLIIRWDEAIDEYKDGHDVEIRRLQTIFKLGYNYGCTVVSLPQRRPQVALNFAVLNHIHTHNDDNTLLIVYYTGHGNRLVNEDGSRDLELSPSKNALDEDAALWHWAEEPLRLLATCDVLAILDCCYASTAAYKSNVEDYRTFQLLAASAEMSTTNEPGEHSFTNALCESLEALGTELNGAAFSVLKLFDRINRLRPSQPALLWDRLNRSNDRSINLGRLEHVPLLRRPTLVHIENPEKASLFLRISLKDTDIEDQNIEKFARGLHAVCTKANFPVHKIQWVEMKRSSPERVFRTAIDVFQSMRTQSSPDQVPKVNPLNIRTRRMSSTESLYALNTSNNARRPSRSSRKLQRRVSIQPIHLEKTVCKDTADKAYDPWMIVLVTLLVLVFMPLSFEEQVLSGLLAVGVSYFFSDSKMKKGPVVIDERQDGAQAEPQDDEPNPEVLYRSSTWPLR